MWILICLAAALLLKAYTSREIQHLLVRIHDGRNFLREANEGKRKAARWQDAVENERKQMEFTVRRMKAHIGELEFRLEGTGIHRPSDTEAPCLTDVAARV